MVGERLAPADRGHQIERNLVAGRDVAMEGPTTECQHDALVGEGNKLKGLGLVLTEAESPAALVEIGGRCRAVQAAAGGIAAMIAGVGGDRGLAMCETRLRAQTHRRIVGALMAR